MTADEVGPQTQDEAVEIAAASALESIREMMQQPVRLAPFAIVLGSEGIATMPILDLSERIPALRYGVARVHGYAFILFYDGVLDETGASDRREHRDALFHIQMTDRGVGKAFAYPYVRTPLHGLVFGTTVEHTDLEWIYRGVFHPPESTFSSHHQ